MNSRVLFFSKFSFLTLHFSANPLLFVRTHSFISRTSDLFQYREAPIQKSSVLYSFPFHKSYFWAGCTVPSEQVVTVFPSHQNRGPEEELVRYIETVSTGKVSMCTT